MKKFLAFALLACLSCIAPNVSHAQAVPYSGITRDGAVWNANNFGRWGLRASGGSTIAGTYALTFPAGGYVTAAGSQSFTPFVVGVRIKVGINTPTNTNQETVVITSVTGCGVSSNTTSGGQCSVTATFAHPHGAGTAVVSGSCGLDEGVAVATQNNGGIVKFDTFGGCPVVTTVTGLTVVGSTASMIEIFTNPMPVGAGPTFYTWKGSAYTTP